MLFKINSIAVCHYLNLRTALNVRLFVNRRLKIINFFKINITRKLASSLDNVVPDPLFDLRTFKLIAPFASPFDTRADSSSLILSSSMAVSYNVECPHLQQCKIARKLINNVKVLSL